MTRESLPAADPARDLSLEALLAVEPSEAFHARVIASVAGERPGWAFSPLARGGALAAVLLAAVLASMPFIRSAPRAVPGPARLPAPAPAPHVTPSRVLADAPAESSAASAGAARHEAPRVRRRPAGQAVLVAPDESRALARFLARERPLRLILTADQSPLPLSADAPAFVPPLEVPALAIEPIASGEDLPGGVRP
jgi:hypothetical protein